MSPTKSILNKTTSTFKSSTTSGTKSSTNPMAPAKSIMNSNKSLLTNKSAFSPSPSVMTTMTTMMNNENYIRDTPSQIEFDNPEKKLPQNQRYDSFIGIKSGLKKKKIKPNYDPTSAPVYVPGQQERAVSTRDDEDYTSARSMMTKRGSERSGTGDGDAELDVLSPTITNLILGSAIFALLVGIGCFACSVCMIVVIR